MTTSPPIPDDVLDALRSGLAGAVVLPSEPGYDEARSLWNARFDRRPDLVVRARTARDVAHAVNAAREHGVPLSVKGGGHDYAGNSVRDGGLLLDLGLMDAVSVDPEARRVRVGPGARWGQVDTATQPHGLATPGGTVSHVGVSGFVLGGGGGWLTRKFGLAVDNLMAAEVVTAAGEVIRASEAENPDLLWGLRGGGGNFGVVTEFELQLHPFGPEILGGQILYPLDRAREVLRAYRDEMRRAPDEVACFAFFIRIPPMEIFPEAIHGQVVLDLVVAYAGPPEEGEVHLAPFRQHEGVAMDTVGTLPYVALQQSFDAGMAAGNRWYSRYLQLTEVTDAFIDALLDNLDPFPGPLTAVYLGAQGGAPSRVPSDATAFPHRDLADALHIFPGWMDPSEDEAVMAWARGLFQTLRPHAAPGIYSNMLAEDEDERLPEAWLGNRSRLAELKRRWDPGNLFRGNHNVQPDG